MSKPFRPYKSVSKIQSRQQSPIHFAVPDPKPSLNEVLESKIQVEFDAPDIAEALDLDNDEADDLEQFVFPFSSKSDRMNEDHADRKPKNQIVDSSAAFGVDDETRQKNLELDFSDLCESNFYPVRSLYDTGDVLSGSVDSLKQINRYCWDGARDLAAPIDILVLGDGPRDAVLTLAGQLADYPKARITYCEPNEKIREHTKCRLHCLADKQNNLRLMDKMAFVSVLPEPNAQRFDYISFQALFFDNSEFARVRALLKENGVLGLEVRGQVAHAPHEQLRNLMEIVNRDVDDIQEQIDNTALLLRHLPKSNPIVQNGLSEAHAQDRVRLYFDFIKPGYRSFAFLSFVEWLKNHRLKLARFQPQVNQDLELDLDSLPQSIQRQLKSLSQLNRNAFAELFCGNINRFGIYALSDSPQNCQ